MFENTDQENLYFKLFSQENSERQWLWRRGLVAITAAQLNQTESESRFLAGSKSGCDMSEGFDDGDLRKWYWQTGNQA